MRTQMVSVPVTSVEPGSNFSFLGTQYVRATKEQEAKHPAAELLDARGPGTLVLAYMLGYRGGKSTRTPISIVSDSKVWIKQEVGR